MTLKQIASELTGMGLDIQYRVRPDGGIVITQIGDVKYSGRAGNIRAREIAGKPLSTAQVQQRSKVSPLGRVEKGRIKRGRPTPKIDAEIRKALQRAQRAFRKYQTNSGRPTIKNVRQNLRTRTKEEVLEMLENQVRYAKGLVYIDNIISLRQRAYQSSIGVSGFGEDAMKDAIEYLDQVIKDDGKNAYQLYFENAKEELYAWEMNAEAGKEQEAIANAKGFRYWCNMMVYNRL